VRDLNADDANIGAQMMRMFERIFVFIRYFQNIRPEYLFYLYGKLPANAVKFLQTPSFEKTGKQAFLGFVVAYYFQ
jgi:hypothetical protein